MSEKHSFKIREPSTPYINENTVKNGLLRHQATVSIEMTTVESATSARFRWSDPGLPAQTQPLAWHLVAMHTLYLELPIQI